MISLDTVLELHENLVIDGECLAGIREKGLLESAIEGQRWYDGLLMQYVHVAYSINAGHLFSDGNKRTCFLVLKTLNLSEVLFDDRKLARYILELAKVTVSKDTFYIQVEECVIKL